MKGFISDKIRKVSMELEEVKKFVKEKHGNQTRKQGTPYFLHPFAVAEMLHNRGFNIEYQVTGLLHDLIEDTTTTYEEIEKLSNNRITKAVKLLTKEDGYDMESYISRIEKNEIAKAVKLVDRIHNLSEAYLASEEFRKKYSIETEKWYTNLAKGTPFEKELNLMLNKIKNSLLK